MRDCRGITEHRAASHGITPAGGRGEALARHVNNRTYGPPRAVDDGATHIHGDVPGHVDMRFVLVHPDLSRPQGVPLGIVVDVIVVGLLRPLDVCHSSARENLHAAPTLPHLNVKQTDRQTFSAVLRSTYSSVISMTA
ncbi:hypothetical protein JZ751_023526 [Albula glossodonta]|uniref:Uncharacterized protein n=1 Tax=Albula glossodonta TaxID=121402 RepID=A0A8T2NGW3_9TELE|nr:hypothetical protein JZ751_023526 [Albula glossodonta]